MSRYNPENIAGLYDDLRDRLDHGQVAHVLEVLSGRRVPTLRSVALATAWRDFPALLARHPGESNRHLARRLREHVAHIAPVGITHVTVAAWRDFLVAGDGKRPGLSDTLDVT